MRIYAFHLLNDYSGSPKVLMQLVKGWTQRGLKVTIVTCTGREGFLSNIDGADYLGYWYRWAANPWLRLVNLVASQAILAVKLMRIVRKDDIIYVNTVLPFGAALLGKLIGCRVIYHIHETSMKPIVLKKFLFGVVRYTATDVIYVSNYLALNESIPAKRFHVLPNAIENKFVAEAHAYIREHRVPNSILMVCSLKPYKGVTEFITLARLNSSLQFRLVVNASQQDIDAYLLGMEVTENLQIFPTQTYLHNFYNQADVIVNLSKPDAWIETFGLTIIEGMAHSLPAIIPPVGGITELVEDGYNGYWVDSRDTQMLSDKLLKLCDPDIYREMQKNVSVKIAYYSEHAFLTKSFEILMCTSDGKLLHNLECT